MSHLQSRFAYTIGLVKNVGALENYNIQANFMEN